MPFINNEQLYATRRTDDAYTQIDVMEPTLPLPQVQSTTQLSNEDIALITLTVILILIGGAAFVRLFNLLLIKEDPAPRQSPTRTKAFTDSSSSLPLTLPSTPHDNDFSDFPNEKIERDITFSFPFFHPESPEPPYTPSRLPAFLREEEEDIAAMLSLRAGEQSVGRRGHRDKKESESSSTTATTIMDSLCPSVPASSVTSIYTISAQSDDTEDDEELEELEEAEVYEVKRAQTQSMEVKRGVLMSWRMSRPSSPIPEMPTVVISESSSDPGALNNKHSFIPATDDSLLRLPSLLVTHPSEASLISTASSVSVDLDEFPLPPTLPPLPRFDSGDVSSLLAIPGTNCKEFALDQNQMSKEKKRSTVEQVITMYETE